jgi:predicted hydrocarbon binding protein
MTTAAATASLRLPAAFLGALHDATSRDRSPAEAAALLREVGYAAGPGFAAAFADWLTAQDAPTAADELDAERYWSALSDFFEAFGWGALQLERPHAGVGALDAEAWVEADARGAHHSGCHVSTGVLAELLRRATGTEDGAEIAVLEAECRGRGDARCRFLFGSPAALEAVYAALREGDATADDALARLG